MTFRLLLPVLCCLAVSCAKLAPGGSGLGDSCVHTSDCLDPFVCENGQCQPDLATACAPDTLICNGDQVWVCQSAGQSFVVQSTCQFGCVGGACLTAFCTPNAEQCSGPSIQVCAADGSGWETEDTCPTTCEKVAAGSSAVQCSEPVCSPFATQCDPTTPSEIDTCNENGTALTESTCPIDEMSVETTCAFGRCLPVVCQVTLNSDGSVNTAEQQCEGVVAEQCDATGTQWDAVEVCPNGCVFDASTGQATCPPSVCTPFTSQCASDGVTVQQCNSTGTAFTSSTCAKGSLCVGGACYEKLCDYVSATQHDSTCSDNEVLTCDKTQTAWDPGSYCQYGCTETQTTSTDGGTTTTHTSAACAPAACSEQETTCNAGALEVCQPDQSAYGFVEYCLSGCLSDGGTTAKSYCALPFCPPLNQQCVTLDGGAQAVELCSADGTEYKVEEECPEGCLGGECIVTNDSCPPGDYQCEGAESQLCVQLPGGATQWQFVDHCLDECVSGACVSTVAGEQAPACGCLGGPSANVSCGLMGTVQPISVAAALPSGTTVPCSNSTATSRVLVYTAPITSAEGVLVPNGTMVTFSNSSPAGGTLQNLIVSADADPMQPGVQRPTLNGQADVLVTAPSCSASGQVVTITASAGGSCEGSTNISFVQAPSSGPQTVFIAEDFTSTQYEDRTTTTAQWNTALGAAIGAPDYSLGSGSDNSLEVTPGETFDLQAQLLAPEWDVTAISTQGATLSTVNTTVPTGAVTLVPGDEVLLITTWGPSTSSAPGTYEFKHILTNNENGTVTFDQPVQFTYGANGTNNLAGHRVVLQRVPQFENVTVDPMGTLTSTGPTAGNCSSGCTPTGGSGVMAFRARGTVLIHGSLSMNSNGLPPNLSSYPSITPTASLNALLMGSAPTVGTGGGIIYIAAGTVSFAASATANPLNYSGSTGLSIQANASGQSAGNGTIWVQAGALQFGPPARLVASSGTGGHVRIDYGTTDNASPWSVASGGTVFAGQAGGFVAQTIADYPNSSEVIGSYKVAKAALIGAFGGPGATSYSLGTSTFGSAISGESQVLPGISVCASADNGATFGDIDPTTVTSPFLFATGQTSTLCGSSPGTTNSNQIFKYKLVITPPSDQPLEVRGIAIEVGIQ